MMSKSQSLINIYLRLMYLIGSERDFDADDVEIDDIKMPEKLFKNYYKLKGQYQKVKEEFNSGYIGISREGFRQQYKEEDLNNIQLKINSFKEVVQSFESKEGVLSNYHLFDNEHIQTAYEHYCFRTFHKHKKPVPEKILSDEDDNRLENMIESIGRDIVKRDVIREVENHLKFNSHYKRDMRKMFTGVADACWKFFEEDNSITQGVILHKVVNECQFKKYAHLDTDEAQKKAENAAKQWFRDIKKHNNIRIPK